MNSTPFHVREVIAPANPGSAEMVRGLPKTEELIW
jgi:hypothetical protein